MTDAEELVRRTCAAQGLPERITDPDVIARIARIIASPRKTPAGGANPRPATTRSALQDTTNRQLPKENRHHAA